ncbi:MAG: L-iditol 2-dehydrogenase [Burkholderiaceae bacterium]|nr:L-iditol 2-dehydrogenase [Burkholderiaceae bacterium]
MTSATPHQASPSLHNKHALLTGAGGGIGLAVAQAYLAAGAHCTVVDMAAHMPPACAALLHTYPDQLQYVRGDVTQAQDIAAIVSAATQTFGNIHVLFNNAAVFDMAPLLDSDEAMYDKLFSVNVKGAFFMMQAVLKHMVDVGTKGSIINMASQAGRRGEALVSHYCASKAAVISYTQSAALAMAPHHIRVNAIAPGVIDTPMWAHVDSLFARYEHLALGEKKKQVGLAVPLGYMGAPSDIAGPALFLASDAANYVTAQTLNVDGGSVMS